MGWLRGCSLLTEACQAAMTVKGMKKEGAIVKGLSREAHVLFTRSVSSSAMIPYCLQHEYKDRQTSLL